MRGGIALPVEGSREDAQGRLLDCRLVAERRLRFKVQLDDPSEADAFQVVDAEGAFVPARAQTANRYHDSPGHVQLEEGRSRHLFLDESAHSSVLMREGEEVRRVPLALEWLRETVIR